MSQETNLNVAPYFDDFNEPVTGAKDKDYYKVLFKPGYPVQARELTTLQSMLQNQVEQFGNHFFKEGAKVIPGDLTYIQSFYAVQVESDFLGIPVSLYLDNLVGLKIRGETSGVVAIIKKVITATESDRGNITLYVDYYESNTNNVTRDFNDGENLITDSNITFGNTFISEGEGFARTIPTDACSTGSAMALGEGVYYIRGYFVNVDKETLILDQYTNTPSYRVGLDVIEEVINADIDPTINDNANGFNNFAAPGADRLKITAELAKKPLDNFESPSFIELANVKDGILRKLNTTVDYNFLGNELARRTFDESGSYYIKPYETYVKESLNNGKGNNGIYKANQLTSSGKAPSEDLMIYKVGPGKSYVRGFECETISSTLLDVPKPRQTKLLEGQAVNFDFGTTLRINNVSGSPSIGINTSTTVSLRANRVGVSSLNPSGKEIGVGRVYDYALEAGSYEASNYELNKWDISLFDVQTYGDLQVNESVTLTVPTYIQGDSSGATAFLKNDVSAGTALTVYQISGNFINGEKLVFDNTAERRVSIGWTNYGMSDVQSIYGTVGDITASGPGYGTTFSADIIPKVSSELGIGSISGITEAAGFIATFTSPSLTFPGIVTTGNLIQWSRPGYSVPIMAKVNIVNTNSLIIQGVTTVTGICEGLLSFNKEDVTDFSIINTQLQKTDNNERLFVPLPKKNVASADLTDSSLIVREQWDNVTITISSDGKGSTQTFQTSDIGPNLTFLPFDEERYVLTRSDGSTEPLTSDMFDFTNGSTALTINGLGAADTVGNARLIATLRKDKVTSKSKRKGVVEILTLDKSSTNGSGNDTSGIATTRNDGLTYGSYPYGTRVQDEKISLNIPDIIKIHAVYQSSDAADPILPNLTLSSLDGPTGKTDDLIIGEEFVGSISGARGMYAVQQNSSKISFVYLNENTFEAGEIVNFLDSGVNGIAGTLDQGSTNITKDFTFYNGQTLTYYGYSYLLRKQGVQAPNRRITVVYAKAYYDSSDTGDITTVNSYDGFNYGEDINKIGLIRNTDIIDARPRVGTYSVAENAASPFEFAGRSFADGSHSAKYVLASDESETLSFSYYLPRLDRIYLTKDGVFQVKIGEPADIPKLPGAINDAINVANIALPPYLYEIKNAQVSFVDHKRYQMSDIFRLENRIKNLEYYTTLSLLENNTANLFISDSQGQNRFKSGYLVDNFSSVGVQDVSVGVKNSLDLKNGHLRPSHFTTKIGLELGSDAIAGLGTTSNTSADHNFLANITGTNIKRTGQVLSLDYEEEEWLVQPFGTRVENVTPYLVTNYTGSIELDPTTDVWIDVNRLELRDVMMEGSFRGVAEALRAEITDNADGSRMGVSPIIWNSWETNNITQELGMTLDVDVDTSMSTEDNGGGSQTVSQTTEVSVGGSVSLETTLDQRRTGVQHTIREQIDTESLGDRIVSRNIIQFMRARNIQFISRRLKPNTQVYGFFDRVDINSFIVPKLLEISMTSGTFQVGETVIGIMPVSETVADASDASIPYIEFRPAVSNHKYGPFNAPTDWYAQNPYDRNNNVPATYSATSTILNIDTFSLANQNQPEYWGWVRTGMILRGQTSGAVATLTDLRLVSDNIGTLIGSYRVPDGNVAGNPIFETGRSVFRLTNSSTNDMTGGVITTSAEEIFYSQGDSDNTQEVTLSLRNARVTHEDFEETRQLTASSTATANASDSSTSSTEIVAQQITNITNVTNNTNITNNQIDPLAQSFYVDDTSGIFVTSLDIFIRTKDDTLPLIAQIREMKVGMPTLKVLPFSEVEVPAADVNTSADATTATRITFPSPVYLAGDRYYALVLMSHSTEYTAWIARMGEADVTSAANEAGTVLVSQQPTLGSLFKSQNAQVWTPSQYEDLKFTLNRAKFVSTGSVQFFNPPLPEDVQLLRQNPFDIDSRTIRVGLGTTVQDTGLTVGNLIIQSDALGSTSGPTGRYVGSAGTAHGDLQILNAGIGYTPSSGSATFSNVTLTNVTSNGRNAVGVLTVSSGVVAQASITDGGTGYSVGDVLTATVGLNSVGRNVRLSVQQLAGVNELLLDEVQGEFKVGAAYSMFYNNSVGIATTMNGNYQGTNGAVILTSSPQEVYDGLHFKVNQRNHGMHSDVNKVTIKSVKGNIAPTSLSADYSASSTDAISVGSTENLTKFENISVGSTNPGYVKIANEIIKYTGVAGNTLTGITRARDNTVAFPYDNGNLVHKYEMNGVSLLRINRTHDISDGDISEQIGLDYYYLKAPMATGTDMTDRTGSGSFPPLYFNETKKLGGDTAKATYNVPFEMVTPDIVTINPKMTTISSAVRTISGKSINGTENPYVDKGFQAVSLGAPNYFDTPRVLASSVNEDARLQNLPGRKSFTVNMDLLSADARLSPMVDLSNPTITFTSNRVNAPISNYITDKRANTIVDDPSAFYYVSRPVRLENSATAINLLLTGAINEANDIRGFYSIQNDIEEDVIFTPFPGHVNLSRGTSSGEEQAGLVRIIDPSANNGKPDNQIVKNTFYDFIATPRSFKEYRFTVDDLPAFKIFRIKLVMSSTNQALAPVIQDLRAIALA